MELLPLLQPDRYYHIYNRGNNRENLFIEERNYSYFLNRYSKYINPIADTYAFCLMKNHFHLLVRIKTPEEQMEYLKDMKPSEETKFSGNQLLLNPTQQFSNFFNSYAKSINKAYGRTGSLFQHRFKRIEVNSDSYLIHLVRYIHLNPQKHCFIDKFMDYRYSSYKAFLSSEYTQIKRNEILKKFGGKNNYIKFHESEPVKVITDEIIEEDY